MSVSEYMGRVRCVVLGEYLVEQQATVRKAAAVFGVSKSTVHKDVTQTLRFVNKALYAEVQELLQKNKQERHLRGGEATKIKYSELHRQKLRGQMGKENGGVRAANECKAE